jgi:hypothetical protein
MGISLVTEVYCNWGITHGDNTITTPVVLAYEPPTFCFGAAWVG